MSHPKNQIDLKPLRLTIIILLPVDNIQQAETMYEIAKRDFKKLPNVTITGNVTKIFDPCCGKEGKKP